MAYFGIGSWKGFLRIPAYSRNLYLPTPFQVFSVNVEIDSWYLKAVSKDMAIVVWLAVQEH